MSRLNTGDKALATKGGLTGKIVTIIGPERGGGHNVRLRSGNRAWVRSDWLAPAISGRATTIPGLADPRYGVRGMVDA